MDVDCITEGFLKILLKTFINKIFFEKLQWKNWQIPRQSHGRTPDIGSNLSFLSGHNESRKYAVRLRPFKLIFFIFELTLPGLHGKDKKRPLKNIRQNLVRNQWIKETLVGMSGPDCSKHGLTRV
jgi:hypothetical protein